MNIRNDVQKALQHLLEIQQSHRKHQMLAKR